jgi:hypothetical protein
MPLKGYKAHKALHQDSGSDELSVAGLSGELADRQKSKAGDSTLGWTDEKLLKGAGAGVAPEEIDVPSGGGPTIVRKTADEIVNNSITLQNDDHLLLAVAANEIWLVELHLLFISASINSDWKFGWAYPSGCSVYWGPFIKTPTYWHTSVTTNAPEVLLKETDTISRGSDAVIAGAIFHAIVINGATAGTLNFRWCQNTATVEDTKVLANSCLIAYKLA